MEKLNSVLVIGGTGLIGYHTAITLLKHDYKVTILSRNTQPYQAYFPSSTHFANLDIDTADDHSDTLTQAFKGIDVLIYATGADSRTIPKAPADSYYHHHNVEICEKVLKCARAAGVRRIVIMGSYFNYLDRIWPDLKLSETQPYIRSRKEQTTMALGLGSKDFTVSIIEIPYVIGSMPGRKPMWTPLVKYLRAPFLPHFTAHGGTALITVQHLAEATRCILEAPHPKEIYSLGEKNIQWAEFNQLFCLGKPSRKDLMLPDWLIKWGMSLTKLYRLAGKEPGLTAEYAEVMLRNSYLDTSEYFNLTSADPVTSDSEIREAFLDTIKAAL